MWSHSQALGRRDFEERHYSTQYPFLRISSLKLSGRQLKVDICVLTEGTCRGPAWSPSPEPHTRWGGPTGKRGLKPGLEVPTACAGPLGLR